MKKIIPYLFCLIAFAACQQPIAPPTGYMDNVKAHRQWFAKTNSQAQIFELSAAVDSNLLSQWGSILFVPAHNFVDSAGQPIEGKVRIEWLEIHSPKEALDNGLPTTTDKGEILETAGMFYFNASANGQQVYAKSPIRVETQAFVAPKGLQLYQSTWQTDNKLVWTNPQELAKDMTPIDINALRWRKGSNRHLGKNKPTLNQQPQKVLIQDGGDVLCITELMQNALTNFGKTALQKTWIATKEFDSRLQCLQSTCSLEAFLLYLKNTDKMLWEVDQQVAELLQQLNDPQASNFEKFAAMRCTRLRDAEPLSKELIRKQSRLWEEQLKLSRRLKEQNNLKESFDYPVEFYVKSPGYYNLDCTIERCSSQDDCLTNLILSAQIASKNTAPNLDIKAFLLLKDAESIIKLDLDETGEKHIFKAAWMPKGKEALLFVRDQSNAYAAYQQITFNELETALSLKIQPIHELEQPLDVVMQPYFKPRGSLLLKDTENDNCCNHSKTFYMQ
jgi:hypothetical protein